jgi:sulfopyruvate decarboxylase TPP-binding subunit
VDETPAVAPLVDGLREVGVTFFTGVADSAFKKLIAELEATELEQLYVLADREDNAVALAVGAYLAGRRPLVFMESSGVGNAIDALTSLAIVCEAPLVVFVGWAGYEGRDVPHHNVIGEPLEPLLGTLGLPLVKVALDAAPGELAAAVGEALRLAESARRPAAVLGIPRL